jgi:hypothetical protein
LCRQEQRHGVGSPPLVGGRTVPGQRSRQPSQHALVMCSTAGVAVKSVATTTAAVPVSSSHTWVQPLL